MVIIMENEELNVIKSKLEENLSSFGILMRKEAKLRHELSILKKYMEDNAKEFQELQNQLREYGMTHSEVLE